MITLLTGSVPRSLKRSRARAKGEGAWPLSLEVDSDRYPDDWQVEQIGLVAPSRAAEWLLDVFPDVWVSLAPYAFLDVTDIEQHGRPSRRIAIATGGWSGCESVIGEIMDHFVMRSYCDERRSGGGFVFIIPLAHGRAEG